MREPTIFELSSPGRTGVTFPVSDVPKFDLPDDALLRKELPIPELAEVDVVRHYTHLSHYNYSVDEGFYPLGSCTMKYNPKINEDASATAGSAGSSGTTCSRTSPKAACFLAGPTPAASCRPT